MRRPSRAGPCAHSCLHDNLSPISWVLRSIVLASEKKFSSIEIVAEHGAGLRYAVVGKCRACRQHEMSIYQRLLRYSQFRSFAMITQARKTGPAQVTGHTYKAFWYVFEIGRWVESVEEYYGSNGVRNERYTAEPESFKRSTE
ncbi:hypothetical protein LMG28690_00788 [Paraburkholderia caffeinilytica]|nr:hypothetical protein LMG28690_00788 [Paraburkholderia caffeinilytica]